MLNPQDPEVPTPCRRFFIEKTCRNIKCAIVGLPNSGKSSLFNLLSEFVSLNNLNGRSVVEEKAAKNPFSPVDDTLFTTTDPYISIVDLSDDRLLFIAEKYNSTAVLNQLTLIDLPGLVNNSIMDEGLGSDFLAYVQEVDVILNVVRAFKNENISHVEETIDPIRDIDTVYAELIVKDIEYVSFLLSTMDYNISRGKCGQEERYEFEVLRSVYSVLTGKEYAPVRPGSSGVSLSSSSNKSSQSASAKNHENNMSNKTSEGAEDERKGIPLRYAEWERSELVILQKYQFLTSKDIINVINISMKDYLRPQCILEESLIVSHIRQVDPHSHCVQISIEFEEHYRRHAFQSVESKAAYEFANPSHHSSLEKIFENIYRQLELIKFYTYISGESKVWLVKQGSYAPDAAGILNTEYERNFICVDVMTFDDFEEMGGEAQVKRVGKMRQQGKKYIVNDGDILFFKYNIHS